MYDNLAFKFDSPSEFTFFRKILMQNIFTFVCDYKVEPHLSGAAWDKKIVVLYWGK